MLIRTAALLGSMLLAQGAPRAISLPPPPSRVGVDLATALQKRKTTRSFAARPLTPADLSALLWAGNGVNRPDEKRTAPSAHGLQYIELYVVSQDGVFHYDATAHRLEPVAGGDMRSRLSPQAHVGAAPDVLVIVGDLARLPGSPSDEALRRGWMHATAGTIAQNVALMAAAKGIGTGMVGGFDAPAVTSALHLTGTRTPLYLMPVGYLR